MEESNELKKCEVDVASLQEVRWGGDGVIDRGEYAIWYGGSEKQESEGTVFLVQARTKEKGMEFNAYDSRITYIKINCKPKQISLINVYPPTETLEEKIKRAFYEKLEEVYEKTSKEDILMLAGDFNAQIGRELCYQEVAGPHTLHDVTNQNGEIVCDPAAAMNMPIMSTKFKHKAIHKITWVLPGKTTGN
ncbi:hypothetical protein Zmor_021719 [Zophobas morio]|uniref:Craniofacial development protein 2 n=1 Tax=Zophobas morio TaxID=2755281 RepID=A0AA38I8Q0_9CUCU|nr:hypothetical protein Zmor_021719 [Zophobas morio]